jgi:putative flippase GtrA
MDRLLAILPLDRERHVASQIRSLLATISHLSRYSAASVLALALDFALYLTLTTGAMKPVLAGVLGYGAGLALHFLLSTRFVFDAAASSKAQTRLFGEFALSGLAGIATTAIVVALASDIAGLAALPAKVLATGASFVLVYWLRCSMVFVAPRSERHAG